MRHRLLDGVEILEDAIYGTIAVFLIVCGVLLLIGAAIFAIQHLDLANPRDAVVGVLDQALLVFMVAELLHTVRITLRDHALAAEPFLIIGLIAGIRRVLIVTAGNENIKTTADLQIFWVELLLLITLVLVMVLSLFIWRKAFPPGTHEP